MSEETKKRMSTARKGNTNTKGRIWANNGTVDKLVYPDQIPEGFEKGRLYSRGK